MSPIAVDGFVNFSSDDDHLYAVDIETGQEAWHFKTIYDIHSSPAVANRFVYAESYDGFVYAIDAQTGGEVWKFGNIEDNLLTYMPYPPYYDYLSSTLVKDGVIYVTSLDGCLYILH